MSGHSLVEILVSLLPVFVFLVALVFLDSYKLLPLRSILLSILIGALVAAVAYGVNHFLFQLNVISPRSFSLYVTPVVEELLKSIYLIYLIRRKRIGFMVDGAIHGFAIGAGFSLVENLYYLQTLASQNILLWIIRGFGTAIMHGGVTAIVGIATSEFSNRLDRFRYTAVAPGLFAAILIHALYNFFLLPPVVSTLILMIALPILIVFIFQRSEKTTRSWLGA